MPLFDPPVLLSLELPERVRLGQAVPLAIRVTNETSEPDTLELTGRPPAFDFLVEDPNGNEVWRRLRGQVVSMMLQVRVLQPGESVHLAHTWDQRGDDAAQVQPGLYIVRGMLPSPDGERWTGPGELRVEE